MIIENSQNTSKTIEVSLCRVFLKYMGFYITFIPFLQFGLIQDKWALLWEFWCIWWSWWMSNFNGRRKNHLHQQLEKEHKSLGYDKQPCRRAAHFFTSKIHPSYENTSVRAKTLQYYSAMGCKTRDPTPHYISKSFFFPWHIKCSVGCVIFAQLPG